jgi:hypothetical protein
MESKVNLAVRNGVVEYWKRFFDAFRLGWSSEERLQILE